jgi:hypothetical protein
MKTVIVKIEINCAEYGEPETPHNAAMIVHEIMHGNTDLPAEGATIKCDAYTLHVE